MAAGLFATALAKLERHENVSTEILIKICQALDCGFCDMIKHMKEDEKD